MPKRNFLVAILLAMTLLPREGSAADSRAIGDLVKILASAPLFEADGAGRRLFEHVSDNGSESAIAPYVRDLLVISEKGDTFRRSWASLVILQTARIESSERVTHILRVLERVYLEEEIMLRLISELSRYPSELGRIAPILTHLLEVLVIVERIPEAIVTTLGELARGRPPGTGDALIELARLRHRWTEDSRFSPEQKARVETVSKSLEALVCAIEPSGIYFTSGFPPQKILSCRS